MGRQKSLSAKKCAELIGVSPQFLRVWTQMGKCPFGEFFKAPDRKNNSYIYYPEKVKEYMGVDVREMLVSTGTIREE